MSDPIQNFPRAYRDQPAVLATFGAGLLLLSGASGAVVTVQTRPSPSMAPATPVAIRSLSSTGIVTIRGRVAEIFGNKFVMQDGTGRALIDTGREGHGRQLVTVNQPVTIQGRYAHGFVHAAFLVGPDNKVWALGPLNGPDHKPHDEPDLGRDTPTSQPTDSAIQPMPRSGGAPTAQPAAGAPLR